MSTPTIDLVAEMFKLIDQATSARLIDESGHPYGALKEPYWKVRHELQRRAKARDEMHDINVRQLLREYVAQELQQELSSERSKEGRVLVVRVLGEVLAAKPGLAEQVYVEATELMRELLTPSKESK